MEKFLEDMVKFLAEHWDFIAGIVINIVIIYAICKLIDTFNAKFEQRLKLKNPDSPIINLMPIITKIIKSIVVFLLLAGFLQSFGYNVTSLIAGFGITGLAVGFAAKEAIGNVFGSIGLLADKVYKIGEYISFNGYEGTVENINLRSTTIRNPQGYLVNVPNNLLANEEITNTTQITERRIDISVDIEYGTSNDKIERACEILREIADREFIVEGKKFAFIETMAPSSIVVRLVCFTTKTAWADFVMVKSDIIKQIIFRYREEGIEFAFPSTSVYMAQNQ